jgi:NitT/TauT family transport system ATP-binding protein
MSSEVLLSIRNVSKTFKKSAQQDLLVLEGVSFELKKGEIVALLGKSGSGKSTLLRIISGLVKPTSGEVEYRNSPVFSPVKGISMVFQSFALMPWMTVLQNVELGLEAQGVGREERRRRAIEAIDIIGLDGFESALPKELSGGMQQRVGFARALVVNPDILIMDEPFSALDVLTSENLKSDLLSLWKEQKTQTNAIFWVTHNIEEAVMMADRILIFGGEPSSVRADLPIVLPRPRNSDSWEYRSIVEQVYTLMTSGLKERRSAFREKQITIGYRLPDVDPAELSGLIETMLGFEEHVDLPELADELMMTIDDLFPIMDALEVLGLAKIDSGDILLSEQGKAFASANLQERKKIFAELLLSKIPIIRHIRKVLEERPKSRASEERFLSKLENYLSEKESERVLETAINWARYAELFAYDYNTGMLSLENPD